MEEIRLYTHSRALDGTVGNTVNVLKGFIFPDEYSS